MPKNKKAYENYLNEVYGSDYSSLEYLTNNRRTNFVSMRKLQAEANKGKLGTLLRKYDTIAFECGFSDFNC